MEKKANLSQQIQKKKFYQKENLGKRGLQAV